MAKSHYIIPVFIPELACRNKCIYCNQKQITGTLKIISAEEVGFHVSEHLQHIPEEADHIEIAFFGGNFTGLEIHEQREYLLAAYKYVRNGRVKSIRISTRPDYILQHNLEMLNDFGVRNIELGAQSMCNEVLLQSGRGHRTEDTVKASKLVIESGFNLGLQMMIGLPGDTMEKDVMTAQEIVRLGASETRIYPLVVMKDTPLYEGYLKGKYIPLSLEQAIDISEQLVHIFESNKVIILRIGLHPSDGFAEGQLVAGPWHPAFRQMVYSKYWNTIIRKIMYSQIDSVMGLRISARQYPNVIGYQRQNALAFPDLKITPSLNLHGTEYEIDYC